jgi:type I restriction enzyme M protein
MLGEFIQIGIRKNYISLSPDNKLITYKETNKTYRFTDPEEIVRASYYVELIEKYQYSPSRLDLEATVPRRLPSDHADIVVFQDEERLKPYIIIECKRDGVSDLEFNQAIEQSIGNTNSLRGIFAATIAGNTRRFHDVKGFPQNERESNIIADIPIHYGKIQEFRYKKGDDNWDIKPISKEELIRILGKCNNTLLDLTYPLIYHFVR